MLEYIIDWSIKNKFIVVLVTAFVIIGVVYALFQTPVDAIPDRRWLKTRSLIR